MRFLLHFINLLDILKKKKYLWIQVTQAKLLTCFGVILNSEDKQILKLYLNLHFNFKIRWRYRVSENKICFRKTSWTCLTWLPNWCFQSKERIIGSPFFRIFARSPQNVFDQLRSYFQPIKCFWEPRELKIVKCPKANFILGHPIYSLHI